MTPERWQKIDEIFQAALELNPDERAAFLSDACAGDEELRREVESLIFADEQGLSLIDAPAYQVAAGLLISPQFELKEGERIAHYTILALLGAGGMGEVYLAQDIELGRKVALKLLPTEFTRNNERLRRFQQEARVASTLNHPNILTIHEIGQVNGRHFIATEFIDGETLRQYLKNSKPSLREALEIALQVGNALSAAHEAGVVHRDIKPENIMLRRDGYVKILDFGLAKLTEQQFVPIDTEAPTAKKLNTTPGLIMGTIKYMSPEQARGLGVDARSDIYSLGVVLYEMIAVHAPFEGNTPSDLIAAILKEEPPPLARYLPGAPDELQRIISKALHKEKNQRYQRVDELLRDLKSLKEELELESKLHRSAQPDTSLEAITTSELRAAVPTSGVKVASIASDFEYLIGGIKQRERRATFALAVILIAAVGISLGLYEFFKLRRARIPFQNMKVTKLTNFGDAYGTAISPDGKYVVYGKGEEGGKFSLRLRVVGTTSEAQIVPPTEGGYYGASFSPDGKLLAYIASNKVFIAPSEGGQPIKTFYALGSNYQWTSDGRALAYLSSRSGVTNLWMQPLDGRDPQQLTNFTSDPIWRYAFSRDGKQLAVVRGTTTSNAILITDNK